MKSVKQLALSLNISPQAIYQRRHIDKRLDKLMTNDFTMVGKSKRFGESVEEYLRSIYITAAASASEDETVALLRDQLAEKDKQIAALHQLLNQQQQLLLLTKGKAPAPWYRRLFSRPHNQGS